MVLSFTLRNIYQLIYISRVFNPLLLHLQEKSDKNEMFDLSLLSLLTSLAGVL